MKHFIIIKKERSKSRDSKISLLNEQGDTLEKVIRRTDLNTDYTINSSKSNLKKTLSKSFRNSSKQEVYKVPTDILSQLQQGLDTLTVTLNRTYVAKENGQSFSLENPPTELQIFYHVPKFYEVLVSIDEVSFNKNSKDRIVEGLERSDPDLGISVSVGNNNIYRHYRNNCYHLYPIDPFIIYHTAIDNDVKVTIFDDDIFGDDYYLSKEVKLINLIKEDYSYFNNDIISHSGIKMRIVGTRN